MDSWRAEWGWQGTEGVSKPYNEIPLISLQAREISLCLLNMKETSYCTHWFSRETSTRSSLSTMFPYSYRVQCLVIPSCSTALHNCRDQQGEEPPAITLIVSSVHSPCTSLLETHRSLWRIDLSNPCPPQSQSHFLGPGCQVTRRQWMFCTRLVAARKVEYH